MIMDILSKPTLSDELIAAFVDGRTTPKETQQVLRAMLTDEEVRDLIEYMIRDNDMGDIEDECEDGQTVSVSPLLVQTNKTISLSETQLPMAKMAAKSEENLCGVRCEEFIMYKRNVPFDDCELIQIAKANNWLRKDGVPLFYIGELLVRKGYYVMRRYESNLDDIKRAILEKENVIVAVNSEILYDKKDHKKTEPNHAVVVLSVGPDTVTIFEPLNKFEERIQVPLAKFMLSWEASHCYMVKIFTNPEGYTPQPIQMDSVPLNPDLTDLVEGIAENAHDVWAVDRIEEGYTYGIKRDDDLKKHPDLLPYSALTDKEKNYDRKMAINTIKLVNLLGYDIVKKGN